MPDSPDRLVDSGKDSGLLLRQLRGCWGHIEDEGCYDQRACKEPAIRRLFQRAAIRRRTENPA
jgi:hypothetical protein